MPRKKSKRIGQGDRLKEISPSMNGFFLTQQTLQHLPQAQSSSPGSTALCASVLQHREKALSSLLSLELTLSGGAAFRRYHDVLWTGQHWPHTPGKPGLSSKRERGFYTPRALLSAGFCWKSALSFQPLRGKWTSESLFVFWAFLGFRNKVKNSF